MKNNIVVALLLAVLASAGVFALTEALAIRSAASSVLLPTGNESATSPSIATPPCALSATPAAEAEKPAAAHTPSPTSTQTPPPTSTQTPPPTSTPLPTSTQTSTPTLCPTNTPVPTPLDTSSIRALADAHKILIGAAVASASMCNDPAYHETLTGEFNALTPENAMKFGSLCSGRGSYNFGEADAIVAVAEEHGMKVRGHTLVWHNQLPTWLTERQWSRDELISILHDHIFTVVGHYQGRIWAWDVVNEAVEDDGSLRQTIWSQGIGPEYIEMAFRWAHEADPNALLFYNDYSGEGLNTKSDAIYAMVADLRKRGVPIDGVGLQMHIPLDGGPSPQEVAANMKRLAALGLQVNITEMDVRVPEPATEEELDAQAQLYHKMLDVCLMAKNCTAFEMWGFTDSHSWIPEFFPGTGDALIFDGACRPKPAFNEIMSTLADPAHFK